MKITKYRTGLLAAMTMMLCLSAEATTNIDDVEKYAWGENIGWIDFQGNVTDGVVARTKFLSGYAWSENFGWIYLGNGNPGGSGGTQYTQSTGDTGVNNDGAGNLSGYAWGENVGWICFDTTSSGGSHVTIDSAGHFSGYAWGENVGWINMATGFGVKANTAAWIGDWMTY